LKTEYQVTPAIFLRLVGQYSARSRTPLLDRSGNRVESFGTKIEPDDRALVTALEKLLAEKSAFPEG